MYRWKLITFDRAETIFINKTYCLAKRKTVTEKLHKIIIDAILDKKGKEVISLDLRGINDTASEFFVVTHGDSSTHVKAIFDSVMETTREKGYRPYRTEGSKGAEWMIIDFVDITVHVFLKDKRQFYALEELWSDAVATKYYEA